MNGHLKNISDMRKLKEWLREKAVEETITKWGSGYAAAMAHVLEKIEELKNEPGKEQSEMPYQFSNR